MVYTVPTNVSFLTLALRLLFLGLSYTLHLLAGAVELRPWYILLSYKYTICFTCLFGSLLYVYCIYNFIVLLVNMISFGLLNRVFLYVFLNRNK